MHTFKEEDIKQLLKPMVEKHYNRINNNEVDLYRNTLDCFSAVFEASLLNIDLSSWILLERQRQDQKSMQNSIGEFHQALIGTIDCVEDLGRGNGLDIRCEEKKF